MTTAAAKGHRWAVRVTGVATAALLWGVLPATAGPEPVELAPCVGSQFHAMWTDYTDRQRTEVLDKLAGAGIQWVRIDFGWSSLQPDGPGSYAAWYLDRADNVVDAARARGIEVLMSLGRTPAWANGGRGPNVPPDDPLDYALVADFLAHHFAGRVSAWGVYNEPNHPGGEFWTGSAADYAELLRASYGLFKAGNPAARVVVGHVVHNDDRWLRQMYEAGAQGFFDVLATHPYQGVADEPPWTPSNGTRYRLTHVPAIHRLMCEFGDCHKEIWFTEFGWSSHPNGPNPANWERGVTEEQQADYLIETLEMVKDRYPYVTNVIWYNERNRISGNVQIDNYGLLRRNLAPKPVYTDLRDYLTETRARSPSASRCVLGIHGDVAPDITADNIPLFARAPAFGELLRTDR
jgi:hypothetical protein